MKERIRKIMENEHMTPSAFADALQIGRAVMSHILNGRNNPSLDVVTRILTKVNYVNPDWLLTGNGNMYKSDSPVLLHDNPDIDKNENNSSAEPDLFSQNYVNPSDAKENVENRKEIVVDIPPITIDNVVNQNIVYQKTQDRKVTRIIIYYSDNTFETFNADNGPL